MDNEHITGGGGNGGGNGGGRISADRRQLAQVILDLSAFGQRISAFAERLLDTSGDDRSSILLAAAAELATDFIPAAQDIVLGLRARASRKDPAP
jgi:hypothetical protein